MLVIHYSLGFGYSDIICWVPLKPQSLLNWRKNGGVIALIVGLKANNSCRRCDFTVLGTCLLLLCCLSRTCDDHWVLWMRGVFFHLAGRAFLSPWVQKTSHHCIMMAQCLGWSTALLLSCRSLNKLLYFTQWPYFCCKNNHSEMLIVISVGLPRISFHLHCFLA